MSLLRYLGNSFAQRIALMDKDQRLADAQNQLEATKAQSSRDLIQSLIAGAGQVKSMFDQNTEANKEADLAEALAAAQVAASQNVSDVRKPDMEVPNPAMENAVKPEQRPLGSSPAQTPSPQFASLDLSRVPSPAVSASFARPNFADTQVKKNQAEEELKKSVNILTPAEIAARDAAAAEASKPAIPSVPSAPASKPAEQPAVGRTPGEMLNDRNAEQDKINNAPKAELSKPIMYGKYAKTFDEAAKELGYDMTKFRDPVEMAREIVAGQKAAGPVGFFDELTRVAGQVIGQGVKGVRDNKISDLIGGFIGNAGYAKPTLDLEKGKDPMRVLDPNNQAERIMIKQVAAQIAAQQAAAREKMVAEIKDRVKLSEQKGINPSNRSERLAKLGADAIKAAESELEMKVSEMIGGKYGDELYAIAAIPDVSERAKKIRELVNREDAVPFDKDQINTTETVKGYIISEMMNKGEKFLKDRKTGSSPKDKDYLVSDSTLKELVSIKSAHDDILGTPSSGDPDSNRIVQIMGTLAGNNAGAAAKSIAEWIKEPKNAAIDAKIKRNVAAFLKATSGASATDQEFERIWSSAPNESDEPAVYYKKLADFLASMRNRYNTILDLQQKSGRDIRGLTKIEQSSFVENRPYDDAEVDGFYQRMNNRHKQAGGQ